MCLRSAWQRGKCQNYLDPGGCFGYLLKVAVASVWPVFLAVRVSKLQEPVSVAKVICPEFEAPLGIVAVRVPLTEPVRVPPQVVTDTLMVAPVVLVAGLPLLSVRFTWEVNVAPLPPQPV